MHRKITGLAIAALAVMLATPASAQLSNVGLSLRGGLFFPTDSNTRDNAGQSWVAFGAEYKIKDLSLSPGGVAGNPGALTVSLDYMGKGDYRHVPVLLNYMGYLDATRSLYFSGGLGVGFAKAPTPSGVEDNVRFAYQVGLGYTVVQGQTPVFVEAHYFGSGKTELNGFGFYIGVRL